jgi:predicted metal-dependent peptidase
MPGRTGIQAGDVVIAVDVSGSIGQVELRAFAGEMSGILSEMTPRSTTVVWFDAAVQRVDTIADAGELDHITKDILGGGGTDFRPVFDWVRNEGAPCDTLVVLTDGYGTPPASAPAYPVIWVTTGREQPWGQNITLELK